MPLCSFWQENSINRDSRAVEIYHRNDTAGQIDVNKSLRNTACWAALLLILVAFPAAGTVLGNLLGNARQGALAGAIADVIVVFVVAFCNPPKFESCNSYSCLVRKNDEESQLLRNTA